MKLNNGREVDNAAMGTVVGTPSPHTQIGMKSHRRLAGFVCVCGRKTMNRTLVRCGKKGLGKKKTERRKKLFIEESRWRFSEMTKKERGRMDKEIAE